MKDTRRPLVLECSEGALILDYKQPNSHHQSYHLHGKTTNIPEQACGGNGKISVVELLRRATAHPRDCGLKLRSCCIKSLHSMRATSAKCKSHRIWFCNKRSTQGLVQDKHPLIHFNGHTICNSATYFEAPRSFLVGSSQVNATGIASQALLMVVIVLELGRGLCLRARVEEGAGGLYGHGVDGAVYNLRTRVTATPITTEAKTIRNVRG